MPAPAQLAIDTHAVHRGVIVQPGIGAEFAGPEIVGRLILQFIQTGRDIFEPGLVGPELAKMSASSVLRFVCL